MGLNDLKIARTAKEVAVCLKNLPEEGMKRLNRQQTSSVIRQMLLHSACDARDGGPGKTEEQNRLSRSEASGAVEGFEQAERCFAATWTA
jgi:hypothetical protein